MRAGSKAAISLKDSGGAAFAFGNLAELFLTLGRLKDATDSSDMALSQSNLSGDAFPKLICITTRAESARANGYIGQATVLMADAEAL
jgi:hypothetical protein